MWSNSTKLIDQVSHKANELNDTLGEGDHHCSPFMDDHRGRRKGRLQLLQTCCKGKFSNCAYRSYLYNSYAIIILYVALCVVMAESFPFLAGVVFLFVEMLVLTPY